MRQKCLIILIVLSAFVGLGVPLHEAAGQATPTSPPGVTAQTTALLVTANHEPLRVTGSDGMVHLEYDLILTNVFATPVTITAIDVLSLEGQSLLRLEGDALKAMTRPLFDVTPTDVVPASGAIAAMIDVVVPPDQVPERLTHRIPYTLAPDAPYSTVIGSREILGPELTVDPFEPFVIAPPLRGNRLGQRQRLLRCLGPSLGRPCRRWGSHREFRGVCHRLGAARRQPALFR